MSKKKNESLGIFFNVSKFYLLRLLDGFSDFDELENKLRDYYALEKECKR